MLINLFGCLPDSVDILSGSGSSTFATDISTINNQQSVSEIWCDNDDDVDSKRGVWHETQKKLSKVRLAILKK